MRRLSVLDRDLPPDIFAVVMATGIVSVAADDHRYRHIAVVLAVVASAAFVGLTIGLGAKIAGRLDVIIAESRDPDVALRMFTFVAAACVLGVIWRNNGIVLWVLAVLAAVGWVVLIPLGARDVRSRPRADLRDHAHGSWLLVSVATSGMATTAADLAVAEHVVALGWLALALLVIALGMYVAVTWLIAWRAIAAPFRPDAVTPDSWILMGALAIATLAGDHLLQACAALRPLRPLALIAGPLTIASWIAASLWIPVLLYAEIWRMDQHAGSLRFAGVWWSAVFPLGMYASATAASGAALSVRSFTTISLVMCWIAIAAWAVVAAGMVRRSVTHLAGRGPG